MPRRSEVVDRRRRVLVGGGLQRGQQLGERVGQAEHAAVGEGAADRCVVVDGAAFADDRELRRAGQRADPLLAGDAVDDEHVAVEDVAPFAARRALVVLGAEAEAVEELPSRVAGAEQPLLAGAELG